MFTKTITAHNEVVFLTGSFEVSKWRFLLKNG